MGLFFCMSLYVLPFFSMKARLLESIGGISCSFPSSPYVVPLKQPKDIETKTDLIMGVS